MICLRLEPFFVCNHLSLSLRSDLTLSITMAYLLTSILDTYTKQQSEFLVFIYIIQVGKELVK